MKTAIEQHVEAFNVGIHLHADVGVCVLSDVTLIFLSGLFSAVV